LLFDTKTKNEELVLNSGSFLQKLWPLVKHSNQLQLIQTVSTYETNEIAAQPERVLKRLSTSWHNPIQLPSSQKVAFHQQQNGFQFQANTPQLLGTALHRILQLFAINGWNEWQQMTEDNRHRYLRIQLIQVGILPNALTKSIQLMLTIINKTLNDARGRWILTPHLEAKSEFAITATIDSMIKKLVIDRMFIDNNICWIIDYKTTAFTNEELNAFLAHEQEKYLEKMHLYARAIKMRVAQPIKLGLYFPALSAWQEWDFIE
jgi:ATP-dependent helicase/nuclease subunit A